MDNLIVSLAIIAGGMLFGQALRLGIRKEQAKTKTDSAVSKTLSAAIFIASPIISLGAFWIVDFSDLSLMSVPFIGAATLGAGVLFSLIGSKILKHDRLKTGSYFCCGSAANAGTIGGLLCFAFFGETGFTYSVVYCLLFTPFLYLVSFPGAAYYSGKGGSQRLIKRLLGDKFVMLFFATMIVGFSLNFLGVKRPAFYSTVNEYLIPISSFFLVMALGYKMKFSKIRNYPKEIIIMLVIKYILVPAFAIAAAFALGLSRYGNGVLFKSVIILSAMPVGFNALIPINIYDLDLDLGNSCWIVTTLVLIAVVPVFYFVVNYM